MDVLRYRALLRAGRLGELLLERCDRGEDLLRRRRDLVELARREPAVVADRGVADELADLLRVLGRYLADQLDEEAADEAAHVLARRERLLLCPVRETAAPEVVVLVEDALAEEAVALRLQRAVVDRLGLRYLTRGPVANLLRGRETNPDRVEIIDVDHCFSSVPSQSSSSRSTRSGSPSGPTSASASSSASSPSETSTSSRSPRVSSTGNASSPSWSTRSCPSSASSAVGSRPTARSEPGERSMPSSSAARRSSSSSSRTSTSRPSSESTCTSSASDCISFSSTLNDSGIDGSAMFSPLTIASYAFTRPTVSSDLIVSISCNVYAAPYASSAHTSISPKRWPPNWALPPSGCCVTCEYGPVERACILSSTR